MSKVNKVQPKQAGVNLAIHSIQAAMKRKGLTLADMCRAINTLADDYQKQAILRLRAEGNSIRAIARLVHMDGSRVAALIKANKPACTKATCKKCTCRKSVKK